MNIFSAISIIACMVYLYIGFYAISHEKQNKTNQLFLFFCLAMAIWSFAYAFYYLQNDDQYIWIKISAIGWCTFCSFLLHLVLIFTENRLIKSRIFQISLYIPSGVFFYMSVFLFGENLNPSEFIENFFYIGDFIYNFTFLLTSIILIAVWGIKSNDIRKRKQTRIILVTSISPFLLNLITQTILPALGITNFPLMGHIYSLILILGVYYAMIKYRLFKITPKLLMEDLLQEMLDLVIIILPNGNIIRVNDSTERILGYNKNELYNKPVDTIINKDVVDQIINKTNQGICRIEGVYFKRKNNSEVPVNMSCSFIVDPDIKDVLGTVIVGQDITVLKKLEEEIAEHKKAEEYILYMANHDSLTGLPNRKSFYYALENSLNEYKKSVKKFAVLFEDLDNLKMINDSYGHEAGDILLRKVGKRAKNSIHKNEIIARIGGDEFTFIIFDILSREDAAERANQVLDSINRPINIAGRYFNVSSSIGISIFPDDGVNADLLVNKADYEMYLNKKEKKIIHNMNAGNVSELTFYDRIIEKPNVRSTERE